LLAHGSDIDSETPAATLSLTPAVNESSANENKTTSSEEAVKETDKNIEQPENSQSEDSPQAKSLKCNE